MRPSGPKGTAPTPGPKECLPMWSYGHSLLHKEKLSWLKAHAGRSRAAEPGLEPPRVLIMQEAQGPQRPHPHSTVILDLMKLCSSLSLPTTQIYPLIREVPGSRNNIEIS